MFRIAGATGPLAARFSLRRRAAGMRGARVIDVAGLRSQFDSADALGTKEWMQWNRLDRYDPAVLPR